MGRCANRIANATFEINGKRHHVTANDGRHSLHGGKRGWGMQVRTCLALRMTSAVYLLLTCHVQSRLTLVQTICERHVVTELLHCRCGMQRR